jgi:uncharacterized protein YcfJ
MSAMPRFIRCAAAVSCLALPLHAFAQYDDVPEPEVTGAEFVPASGTAEHVNFAYAQVLDVSPVYADVRVPRPVEQCSEYERTQRVPPASAGGTLIGAIIGGVIGSQVGSGSGRRAATVAGAAIGGAAGHQAGSHTRVSEETRCHTVEGYVIEQQVVGYDVEYRYRGEVFMSRLDHDPGDRLRIRVAVSPVIGDAESGEYRAVSTGIQGF